jgi:hypothetical protein
MNTDDIEKRLLLRSTGELPLTDAPPSDAAAGFARFVEKELPLAAKAPRDYAAEAIRAAAHEGAPRDFAAEAIAAESRKVVAFPRVSRFAAAAAVVAVGVYLVDWTDRSDRSDRTSLATPALAAAPRVTEQLSTRLASLGDDITAARTRISRGRFNRSTTL